LLYQKLFLKKQNKKISKRSTNKAHPVLLQKKNKEKNTPNQANVLLNSALLPMLASTSIRLTSAAIRHKKINK
jgi:hypothetical protein